jgi:hypothetical protein
VPACRCEADARSIQQTALFNSTRSRMIDQLKETTIKSTRQIISKMHLRGHLWEQIGIFKRQQA